MNRYPGFAADSKRHRSPSGSSAMFLARKLSIAKWLDNSGSPNDPITADAITGDLRTRDNRLSFWQCGSAKTYDLHEVVLALASNFQRLEKMYVVWVDCNDILANGLQLDQSPGESRVAGLAHLHVDVCRLDYGGLGEVANLVSNAIANCNFDLFERNDVCDILTEAVLSERISIDVLEEKVRNLIRNSVDAKSS